MDDSAEDILQGRQGDTLDELASMLTGEGVGMKRARDTSSELGVGEPSVAVLDGDGARGASSELGVEVEPKVAEEPKPAEEPKVAEEEPKPAEEPVARMEEDGDMAPEDSMQGGAAVPKEKKKREQREVNKANILAAIDARNVQWFENNCRTKKGQIESAFSKVRNDWATVGKNAQGKKRVEAGTVLMYATYKYAEAPTKEMAAESLAIIVCLLTRCGVSPATVGKHDYLRFITLDAWPMARAEAELVGDNNADAPWCRRTRLFQVLLEQGWLFSQLAVSDALCFLMQHRRKEYYMRILKDEARLALLTSADQVLAVLAAAMTCSDTGTFERVFGLIGDRVDIAEVRKLEGANRFAQLVLPQAPPAPA